MKKFPPTLFCTLGYPGSGKTHFAKQFAAEFGLFHLNSDRIRAEMFPNAQYTRDEHRAVFGVMDYIAGELLSRGVSVMYDANITKKMYREKLQDIAQKHSTQYLLLWFQTPLSTALERTRERGVDLDEDKKYHVPVSEEVVQNIKNAQEAPEDEPYVIIDGTAPYAEQCDAVLKFFQ